MCFFLICRFTDHLSIDVEDGVTHKVTLTGCGCGSTIVTCPSMRHCIQLGPCFSGQCTERKFTVTNRGRRFQSIYWETVGYPLFCRSTYWQKHGKMMVCSVLLAFQFLILMFQNPFTLCPDLKWANPIFIITLRKLGRFL